MFIYFFGGQKNSANRPNRHNLINNFKLPK